MKGILSNIDSLDVDDFLTKVENSFEINFSDDDLQLNTFGELLDSVINKLSLKNEIEISIKKYPIIKANKIFGDIYIFTLVNKN